MTVGERIKELREKIGMSQVDFADKINVSKQTLYKYENNLITNIPSDKIEAAAKIGGVSPAYLMGWSSAKEAADAVADLADAAVKVSMMSNPPQHIKDNSYENLVIKEMSKMNPKGKIKLLETAREMNCNPLYNPNYKIDLAAAHERTDIEVTEEMRKHDDSIMMDDSEWG